MTTIQQESEILSLLYGTVLNLQEGVVDGLNVNARHLYSGNLTVLMGYGPKNINLTVSGKQSRILN